MSVTGGTPWPYNHETPSLLNYLSLEWNILLRESYLSLVLRMLLSRVTVPWLCRTFPFYIPPTHLVVILKKRRGLELVAEWYPVFESVIPFFMIFSFLLVPLLWCFRSLFFGERRLGGCGRNEPIWRPMMYFCYVGQSKWCPSSRAEFIANDEWMVISTVPAGCHMGKSHWCVWTWNFSESRGTTECVCEPAHPHANYVYWYLIYVNLCCSVDKDTVSGTPPE